jgi:ferredoxin
MVDNLARIDNSKCTRCGICVEKCPAKCIIDYDKVEPALPAGAGGENLAASSGGAGGAGSQAAS